jgi:hypothetical protein
MIKDGSTINGSFHQNNVGTPNNNEYDGRPSVVEEDEEEIQITAVDIILRPFILDEEYKHTSYRERIQDTSTIESGETIMNKEHGME